MRTNTFRLPARMPAYQDGTVIKSHRIANRKLIKVMPNGNWVGAAIVVPFHNIKPTLDDAEERTLAFRIHQLLLEHFRFEGL